jgi:hypothetical protein
MRSSRISAGLTLLLRGITLGAASCIAGCVFCGQALAACELHARGGEVTHVVHIQLDNVHLGRDEPNVPSDLEQMPHLREFFAGDGTIGGNHLASPLAQQAPDVLAVLTGLFGDRTGVSIGDSYGSYRSDGGVDFSTAAAYWTARGGDGKPLMLADTGKMVPAPWVPFTRAGCDVGAFATTGLTLQQLDPDAASVLGASDAHTAVGDPITAETDLLGIAIHCARGAALCNNTHAQPDLLPDEPGGYAGFNALFGNRHVQPVISPAGPVTDLDGETIANDTGRPGFPGVRSNAPQSLGYAAAMLEAGVQVVYVSIGGAHNAAPGARADGPGEQAYIARLAAFDAAFGAFVTKLSALGITKRNTLFIAVSTGNDRFTGGQPQTPQCDGIDVSCSYETRGAIGASIDRLLATQRRNVTVFDNLATSAPAFYIHGNPQAADPLTRTLAQDLGKLTALNPLTGKTDRLVAMFADRAQMQIMHMVTASPARTPSFIIFGDPAYLYRTTGSRADCSAPPACVAPEPDVTWLRGDIQRMTGRSWFAIAGPGVAKLGQIDALSHHADLRPTMLALLGLKDSYIHDGVVLADVLDRSALPPEFFGAGQDYSAVARTYSDLNDPLGPFGRASLALSTQAIKGSDTAYQNYLNAIGAITIKRDALAQDMKAALDGAAFARIPTGLARAGILTSRAEALINNVEELASRGIGPIDRPWKAASDAH